jgi:hypothetical protein
MSAEYEKEVFLKLCQSIKLLCESNDVIHEGSRKSPLIGKLMTWSNHLVSVVMALMYQCETMHEKVKPLLTDEEERNCNKLVSSLSNLYEGIQEQFNVMISEVDTMTNQNITNNLRLELAEEREHERKAKKQRPNQPPQQQPPQQPPQQQPPIEPPAQIPSRMFTHLERSGSHRGHPKRSIIVPLATRSRAPTLFKGETSLAK